MSTSSKENNNETQPNRFAFQHFDQECDFGIENEEGERVRKRKRPGRKPNPPSLQERRAQNRAAQKAFREREQQRKAEKEKQWQDFTEEIKELKKQLAITQFEARYLKACVLHLTLSCLIHRGSVPHIWTESRIIPSNSHGEYKRPVFAPYGEHIKDEAQQIPALLDMLLENNNVVDFDKALFITTKNTAFSNFLKRKGDVDPDVAFPSYQSYLREEMITLNKNSQEPRRNFPKNKKKAKTAQSGESASLPNLTSQKQPQQEQSPQLTPSPINAHQLPPQPQQQTQLPKENTILFSPQQQDDDNMSSSNQSSNSQALTVQQKPIVGVIFDPPSLLTSEDFVHMPSLQALHILRLQLKLGSILGNMTPAALLPTALQRVIPHDIRIDYIPGASIRDRMIIFQDYYNIDECFQALIQGTVFMGGDVRDTRNWTIDAKYSLKFWFISHQLVDQTYDDCFDKEDADNVVREYMGNNNDTDSEDGGHQHMSAERSTASTHKAFNRHKKNENVYFREL